MMNVYKQLVDKLVKESVNVYAGMERGRTLGQCEEVFRLVVDQIVGSGNFEYDDKLTPDEVVEALLWEEDWHEETTVPSDEWLPCLKQPHRLADAVRELAKLHVILEEGGYDRDLVWERKVYDIARAVEDTHE